MSRSRRLPDNGRCQRGADAATLTLDGPISAGRFQSPSEGGGGAADGLTRFASYYNYDRLHGELDSQTPAERYDGTPFTARGFERVPSLEHLNGWLTERMTA